MGQQTLMVVGQADYPQLQTNLVILATAIVLANFLTDIAYGVIDPRVSLA